MNETIITTKWVVFFPALVPVQHRPLFKTRVNFSGPINPINDAPAATTARVTEITLCVCYRLVQKNISVDDIVTHFFQPERGAEEICYLLISQATDDAVALRKIFPAIRFGIAETNGNANFVVYKPDIFFYFFDYVSVGGVLAKDLIPNFLQFPTLFKHFSKAPACPLFWSCSELTWLSMLKPIASTWPFTSSTLSGKVPFVAMCTKIPKSWALFTNAGRWGWRKGSPPVRERKATLFSTHWRRSSKAASMGRFLGGRFGMLHIEHRQLQAEVTLKMAVFHLAPSMHLSIVSIIWLSLLVSQEQFMNHNIFLDFVTTTLKEGK
ncbi:MAG: hypothetical protein QW315_05860 [Candidatus Hadarchaeum sp.]